MQIRFFSLIAALTLLLTTSAAMASPPLAPSTQGSASEVIALINDYRAQNGLPAFTQDGTLMQLAQGHSDYQADIKQVTHGGPGGSTPRDRAYAAGYGNGQVIFISELITGGFTQSAQQALDWWKNSPEHNSYLLSDNYYEIGVGVATDGENRYYYTAELGNIASGTSRQTQEPNTNPTNEPQVVMVPVTKAEPRENGALVHIVRQGQALWTIAAVYERPLEKILELNNLTMNSFIFPGDEIVIDPPGTYPTPTPTLDNSTQVPEETETAQPLPTLRPTAQQLAAAEASPAAPLGQASQLTSEAKAQAANTSVILVVGVALLSILGVFVASFFIQRPQAPETSEPDPFAPIE